MFGLTSVGDGYPRISSWTKTIEKKIHIAQSPINLTHGENACLLTIERPNASRDQFAQCS